MCVETRACPGSVRQLPMRVNIRRKPWSVAFPRLRDAAVVSKADGRGRAAFSYALGCVKRQTSPIEP
jgi:hypothetical protein